MRKLVNLSKNKDLSLISFEKDCFNFEFFLSRLYFGIGRGRSHRLTRYLGFGPNNSVAGFKSSTLVNFEVFLRRNFIFEKGLLGFYLGNINKLKISKSYKGFRHRYGLPVNGQSSKNNSRNCSKTDRFLVNLYEKKYRLYRDKMLILSKLDIYLDGKFMDE